MAHKADGDRLKDARKALKDKTPMPSAEYEQMLADIRRIEVAREWLPVADVAMFQIQHCTACDNYAALFTGLFQRQKNRHMRDADRWVTATESQNRGLPKEIKNNKVEISMCSFCIGDFEYPIDQLGLSYEEDMLEDDVDAQVEIADEADAAEQADDEQSPPTAEELEQATWEAEQDELAESLQTAIPAQTADILTLGGGFVSCTLVTDHTGASNAA